MTRFKVKLLEGKKPKGVYSIILKLLEKGKHAVLLNAYGRYKLYWPKAIKHYLKFRAQKKLRRQVIGTRGVNNCFRSALLLKSYVEEGAREYYKASSTGDKKGRYKKGEDWREFRLPSSVRNTVLITENVSDGIMDYEDDMSMCGNSQHGLSMDSNSDGELVNTVGRENPPEEEPIYNPPHGLVVDCCRTGEDVPSSSGEGAICDPVPGSDMEGSGQNHHVFGHGLSMDSNSDVELVNNVGRENPQEEGATCDPVPGPHMDGSDQNHHVSGHGLSMDSNSDVELVNTAGKENPKIEPINPPRGPFWGGYPFFFHVTEKMSDDVTWLQVEFAQVGWVDVVKIGDWLIGIVPPSTVVGDVNVTATATNQLTGATKVLGVKKFEYTIDIPNLVNIIALARGLNQFEAFEWLDSLLRENGVVLGNDREVQHLDTLNVEKQGQSLDALELQVSTAVQKHPQKVINLVFKTLEGEKIISSCMAGEPSEGVGRAKVTQETEVPHSGLEASTLTTQMSSLNISNQTATREGGQCAQTEAIARPVQGDDITSGVQDVALLPIAYVPIKPGPVSNVDDIFSSGTTVRGQKVLGKSVMVLKSRDVCIRGDTVFMPTRMEMALLKKPEKEQFKRDVKILQEMSESDVREKLIEIFPYLEHQRFYCASASYRGRLEFHGKRRIWDGHLIKTIIKANYCLYIYTEEENFGKQDPTVSKQKTLEKPYEQMQRADALECTNDASGGADFFETEALAAVEMFPSCGHLEGGYPFMISYPEEWPLEFDTLFARFEGLGDVKVERLNPFRLIGEVPPSSVPREVPVTVITGGNRKLGMTFFRYCEQDEKTMMQIVLSR